MEFNKEGLFLLAKKITNQNYSLPKNMSLKSNQTPSQRYYHNSYRNETNNSTNRQYQVNESEENINPPSKKGIKFKNKYLEKDNIQINEEKMLDLLSERKKMKLTLSHGNNTIKKMLRKNKITYINLDRSETNNISNISNISNTQTNNDLDSNCKYKKIVKYNTQYEKYNTYNDIDANRVLYNCNSEVFKNKYIADKKSTKIINKNFKLNLTNSYRSNNSSNNNNKVIRNEENNISGNIVNQLYSIKRYNSPNMEEINEENIGNEVDNNNYNNQNNNINNNININININNNINNNNVGLNNIKRIDNKKVIQNKQKSLKRLDQPNKYISFIKKPKKMSNTYINKVDNHSFIGDDKLKDINNTSKKVIKKYISQKIYYFKDKDKNDNLNNNKYIDEEIEEATNNNNEYYKYTDMDEKNTREIGLERNEENSIKYKDFNTYNINVNFISDQNNNNNIRNIENNIKYFSPKNSSLIPMRPNSMLSQKKEVRGSKNVIFYKSVDDNNQIYSSEIVTKRNTENDNNENNNDDKNLEYTRKSIRKKIYKNKPLTATSKENSKAKNIIYHNNNKIDSNQTKQNNIINNKKDIIHLEDLLILEGKFCHLLECLKFENPVPKICVEWWNFYTYCSFFGKFPKLFPKDNKEEYNNNSLFISDYQIAHEAVMFELLSMIIIYKILCDPKASKNLINNLKKLINEVHQNFLIECDYILSRVNCNSITNIWIRKLKNLILAKKNWEESYSEKDDFHLNLLKQGNNSIQNIIQYIIEQYSNINSSDIDINSLIYFNENISKIHLIELSGYFNKAINQENIKINKTFSYIVNNNVNNRKKYISIVVPYLPEEIENKKNYTLVLDLDETLISFKFDEHHIGMLKMRPGLYNFLENVRKKYEIVIFTAGTQEYADPILDKIEKNGKIFAKRLYRQHATLMNNIYLKDLTRLGRDLSKIIIVDNMPQNFSLQKENGILIKNYFGEDKYDTTLSDLTPILLKIASKPDNDVRKELKKYREEIFTKITTNLKC